MTNDVNATNHEIPPDDQPVRRDLGDGIWLQDFKHVISRMPKGAREQIPDDFWLDPAWLFGDNQVGSALLVSHPEQVAIMAGVNAGLRAVGQPVIPTWGPEELAFYLGDLHVVFDEERLARFILRVGAAAFSGIEAGRQATMAHLANLKAIEPVATSALLALVMAQVVASKPLPTCTQEELNQVHAATGQLLLAVGRATSGPLQVADLQGIKPVPAAPSPPAPEARDEGRGTGLYL